MMERILHKKSQVQLSIRRNHKECLFAAERQALVSNRVFSSYTNLCLDFLVQGVPPLQMLHKAYQDLTTCSSEQKSAISSSVALLLRELQLVVIESDAIELFLHLAQQLLSYIDAECLQRLASTEYLNWLFKWLLQTADSDFLQIESLFLVFTSFSEASLESKLVTSEQTIQKIIDRHCDKRTTLSRMILTATLRHTSPNQLGLRQKKKLSHLAKSLFKEISSPTPAERELKEDLLFWVSCLISYQREDWPIFKRMIGLQKQLRYRLSLLELQTSKQSWIGYSEVRTTLLELDGGLKSSREQSIFLNIVRSSLLNSLCDRNSIIDAYNDFFRDKMEVLIQKPLYGPLLQFFAVSASTLLKVKDPMIPRCIIWCLDGTTLQNEQGERTFQTDFSTRMLLMEALLENNIISECNPAYYLTEAEARQFWSNLELIGQPQDHV